MNFLNKSVVVFNQNPKISNSPHSLECRQAGHFIIVARSVKGALYSHSRNEIRVRRRTNDACEETLNDSIVRILLHFCTPFSIFFPISAKAKSSATAERPPVSRFLYFLLFVQSVCREAMKLPDTTIAAAMRACIFREIFTWNSVIDSQKL